MVKVVTVGAVITEVTAKLLAVTVPVAFIVAVLRKGVNTGAFIASIDCPGKLVVFARMVVLVPNCM